jgi:methanogenic corrinoid protein MtbC1
VKAIVGGAPVDAAFAEKIGADAYGDDAAEAVKQARRLIAVN